jgi:hypothetical protein
MTTDFKSIVDQYAKDFSQHDPEIISLNVRSVDLSWAIDYRGGEEIENEDIPFILEYLKQGVNRLVTGRMNNSTDRGFNRSGKRDEKMIVWTRAK